MILDDIVNYRKIQLQHEKENKSLKTLIEYLEKNELNDISSTYMKESFKSNLMNTQGLSIIAEIKKASPSKGIINDTINPVEVAKTYEKANVQAISVLTEEHYFLGRNNYLKDVANAVKKPVLRKDFIIDEYQIYHAKALGASAILLIAAILTKEEVKRFAKIAKECNLDILFEVHDKFELDIALELDYEIIGVNNRNLKTFVTSINNTMELIKYVPKTRCVISESGVKNRNDIKLLQECGVKGVLVGELLMKSNDIKATIDGLRGDS